jgi:hypothetical protein
MRAKRVDAARIIAFLATSRRPASIVNPTTVIVIVIVKSPAQNN